LNRKLLAGIVIGLIGLFLSLAFWPLASVSGEDLRLSRQGSKYPEYSVGRTILLKEKVISVRYGLDPYVGPEATLLELEDGSLDENTYIHVKGDARSYVNVNDTIYVTIELKSITLVSTEKQFWYVGDPSTIKQAWPADVAFYLIGLLGLVILVVGIRERRTF